MTRWTRSLGIGVVTLAACGAREVHVAVEAPKVVPVEPSASASATSPPFQPPAPTPEQIDRARLDAILARRAGEGRAVVREALEAFLATVPHYALRSPAYAALGDIALEEYRGDAEHLALAEGYYKRALWDSGPSAVQATHGLARIYGIRGDHELALATYERACDREGHWHGPFARLAQEEVPAVFAIEHTPAEAYARFPKLAHDPRDVLSMLVRLAKAYEELGKHPDARAVYDELRRRDPEHVCWWSVHYRHATPVADPATLETELAKCGGA